MKRYPWVKYVKKSQPELRYESPIWLGNHSNGEYFHTQTPYERKLREEILKAGDDKARKLNMDRREFMASAAGYVTALSVIQSACSSTENGDGPTETVPGGAVVVTPPSNGPAPGATPMDPGNTTTPGVTPPADDGTMTPVDGTGGSAAPADGPMSMPGGGDPAQPGQYCFADTGLDPTMCEDAARAALQPPTFIFDAQTHTFDDAPDAAWRSTPVAAGFNSQLQGLLGFSGCPDVGADPASCVGPADYVRLMFLDSDTTMAVLSSWPYAPGPANPNNDQFLAATREWINVDLAKSFRVTNHAAVTPFSQPLMNALADGVGGWKLYPAAPGNGYKMDDATGRSFIEAGINAGVKTFSIHKGLPIAGFSVEHNLPDDIGVVAKDYPEANFIIYHSSICAGQMGGGFTCTPMEGPYVDGSTANTDALITSLIQNGSGPNENVYAALGGAFSQLMGNPTVAGQWLGKLVQYVGDQNVVWGTDSILSGNSPQGQINAFMALQHPMLTADVKSNILGRNLARLYCVDPDEARCQVDQSLLAREKRVLDEEFGKYRWALLGHQRPLGPTTRREFLRLRRFYDKMGIPG